MASSTIYSQLTDVFRELFDDDTLELSPQTTAADIPGWNSLMHVNVILAVEQRFNVRFRTSEIESLHNVGHFAELLDLKLSQQSHIA